MRTVNGGRVAVETGVPSVEAFVLTPGVVGVALWPTVTTTIFWAGGV